MQINPLQAGAAPEPLPSESKGKAPKLALTAVQSEPAVEVEAKRAAVTAALPEPERVAVSVDASRELVYRFVDAKTGEVTSQIPAEQVLQVVRGIQELLRAEENSKVPGVNVRG